MFHVRPALLFHENHRGRQEIRRGAKMPEEQALRSDLKEKAKEFVEKGSEVYAQA